MTEYKKISEWHDEIGLVPGMIFENDSGEVFTIYEIFNKNIVTLKWTHYSYPTTCNIDCGMVVRLIYEPRKKNEMTIQEKINEHKKQIEILEKELEKETLKNVFVKHQYYKIKTKNDTFICKFDMSDSDNKFIWVEFVDRFTRKFSTDDIQKVWHIENLEDVFGFCIPIFERKV